MEHLNPDEDCYILFNYVDTSRKRKAVRLVSITYNPMNAPHVDQVMVEISSTVTISKGVEIDQFDNMTIEYVSDNLE